MTDRIPPALRALIEEALLEAGVEAVELAWDTSLSDDLGVDSFHMVQVLRHIEEAHGLRFTLVDWVLAEQREAHPTYTVGSLVTYVMQWTEGEACNRDA